MYRKILIFTFLVILFNEIYFTNANEYFEKPGEEYSIEFRNKDLQSDNTYTIPEKKNLDGDLLEHTIDGSLLMVPNSEIVPKRDHKERNHFEQVDIKIAKHTWVSTSQKGYGWAAGITSVLGLVFGILIIRSR